jgi:two-component system cell cycle sensor histidine kinase/response regulator CckA
MVVRLASTESSDLDWAFVARSGRVARRIGMALAGVAVAVIVGWIFDLVPATRLSPSLPAMSPNTAVSFLLLGVAVWLAHDPDSRIRNRGAVCALAAVVTLIGVLTLCEYAFDRSLGIDQLLFREQGALAARTSQATATNIVLVGLALLASDLPAPSADQTPAQVLALAVALVSLISLLGYFYGVRALSAAGAYSSMALHTTLGFFACSVAMLGRRSDQGLMRVVSSTGPAGQLARRLLPTAVLLPIILGWLHMEGGRAELYGSPLGVALFAVGNVVCFSVLVWWHALTLKRADQKRRTDEEALRRNEERFRGLVEHSAEAIAMTGPDDRVIYGSPAATRIMGYGPADWARLNPGSLVHPDDQDQRQRIAARQNANPGIPYTKCLRVRHKDGSWRLLKITTVNRLNDPNFRAQVSNFHDITETARVQQALARTEEHLRHTQQMEAIGRLAGGVAHDFNNLLSVVISFATLGLDALPPGDPLANDLTQIRTAGERAAELTKQLLAFSRQQVLTPVVLDLNMAVASMDQIICGLIREDVELRTIPGIELGRVRVDPNQLEQVIINLVVNARDAMPTGGSLSIETGNVMLDDEYARNHSGVTAGPHVMLSVSDTGAGMDAETQARVFEPFFTTKPNGRGSGLGLSTVLGIVQQSEGSIGITSALGKGTTFKVYFPRTDDDARPSIAAPIPMPASLRGTETVLFVEDNAQLRALGRIILQKSGYQVIEADGGTEALRFCERFSGKIDLLVTDVVMPKMNGRELAERLAAIRP